MDLHNDKSKKLSLTQQSQILILGQALAFSFNFLVPVVVVRFFDVSQYGVYKQLFLVIMTLTLILPFGIVESLYYFIPRNRLADRQYIMYTLSFLIIAGLLYLLCMLVFGRSIFDLLNLSHLYQYTVPLSLFIIFMSISLPFEKLLIIQERVTLSSLITVISEILKGICIISATVMTGDLKIVLYALVLFSAGRIIVFNFYLLRNHLFLSIKKFDISRIKGQIRYSFPFGLAVIVATIRRFLHQYFISFLFSTRDFAIYAVGSFQLPMMNVIYTSVSNVVLIRISEYQKQKMYDKIIKIWINSARKLALIYFPVTVLFIISSREFISTIFTERYLPSIPFFIVTLMQIPFDIFITHSILKAFAETKFIFKLNLIFLILTTMFIYVFIQLWGMIGASIGTVLSYGLIRVIEILKIRKLTKATLNRLIPVKMLMKILIICFLSGAITLSIKHVLELNSVLQIFIMEVVLFSFSYVSLIFFTDLLINSEKEFIKRFVYKIRPSQIRLL
jgi:O-antigen/teichoic acid export membrane protein